MLFRGVAKLPHTNMRHNLQFWACRCDASSTCWARSLRRRWPRAPTSPPSICGRHAMGPRFRSSPGLRRSATLSAVSFTRHVWIFSRCTCPSYQGVNSFDKKRSQKGPENGLQRHPYEGHTYKLLEVLYWRFQKMTEVGPQIPPPQSCLSIDSTPFYPW